MSVKLHDNDVTKTITFYHKNDYSTTEKNSGKSTKIKCHNNSRVDQVLGRSASHLAVFCPSRQSP